MDLDFNRIKEVCLYIEDLKTAEEFYHQVLGLKVIAQKPGEHIFFRVGDTVLLCFNPQTSRKKTDIPPHYGGGKQHLAFECKAGEYDKWKAHLRRKQIDIIQEEEWGSGQLSFYFEDPAGNVLEVVQPGMWGD